MSQQSPHRMRHETDDKKREAHTSMNVPAARERRGTMRGPFIIGRWLVSDETLGLGSRSKVKFGRCVDDPALEVALKRVDKRALDETMQRELETEITVLRTVCHPNIVHLLDVVEDRKYVYLVFERHARDLYAYISERRRLPEEEARLLFFQIASAIAALHQAGIAHRDIKLENVLIDGHGERACVADCGFATFVPASGLMDKFCGSPFTVAPEIVARYQYTKSVDVWSLGVVLYAMLMGRFPFDEKSPKKLFERILTGRYVRLPESSFSPEVRDLVEKMLMVNPSQRAGMEEVLAHAWFWGGGASPRRASQPPPPQGDVEMSQ